ncbi:MAG: YraN family protein [Candidatus Falkowbacteria bacterium]
MNYNQKVGQFGEEVAKNYLIRKGYKIVDCNVKTSYQEIDIIAKKDGGIIFVEVKTRTSDIYGEAEDAIDNRKINNLKMAVQGYLFGNKIFIDDVRVDLVAVDIDKVKKTAKIKHYEGIV